VSSLVQSRILHKKLKKKTSDFLILMPRRNFLTELSVFDHPHKLENLSFNLAVIFFLCSQGL
jgi:hypothetical protein